MNSNSIINNIIPERIPLSTLNVLTKELLITIINRDYDIDIDKLSKYNKKQLIVIHREAYLRSI